MTHGFVVKALNPTCFVVLYNRCITGDPTASKQPPQKQKWIKNRRAGGGAVLPCRWLLRVPKGMEGRVVDILNARLPDVEGHKAMSVKVRNLNKEETFYLTNK